MGFGCIVHTVFARLVVVLDVLVTAAGAEVILPVDLAVGHRMLHPDLAAEHHRKHLG